jgi:hypothetical protein
VTEPAQLLQRAAWCYERASHLDDACRCLEASGAWLPAARLHERVGRVEQAAAAYERGGDDHAAARCHEASGAFARAVDSLERAGRPIHAAWLCAHHLRQVAHARQLLLVDVGERHDTDELAVRLVMARADAWEQPTQAAAGLHEVVRALDGRAAGSLEFGSMRELVAWCLELARVLQRPDLGLLVLARHVRDPERWDAWCGEVLGTSIRVPRHPTGASR